MAVVKVKPLRLLALLGGALVIYGVVQTALWMKRSVPEELKVDVEFQRREGQEVQAEVRLDIMGLLVQLVHPCPGKQFDWMRQRITRMWPKWRKAAIELRDSGKIKRGRKSKKILLHFGTLAQGIRLDEKAFLGGPLGELVQWSDLMTTLYILGHDVTFTTEKSQIEYLLTNYHDTLQKSTWRKKKVPFDLIYTDIYGIKLFKEQYLQDTSLGPSRCLFRVLDSFGTEADFNSLTYALAHHRQENPARVCFWSCNNLELQQYFTMFPHTPDNSFMGFVIEKPEMNDSLSVARHPKQGLIYAKQHYMFKGKEPYLDILKEYFTLHGTSSPSVLIPKEDEGKVPDYVQNHGVLQNAEYTQLLYQSKVFIGMGFPYEGPAPLEAIAAGCVFINPRFDPPHSRKNNRFYKEKPTNREITSQHPYIEHFIGEPYAYTIDISNQTILRKTVEKILATTETLGYLPYEFTEAGMIERMNYYVENQDLCSVPRKSHIPDSAIHYVLGEPGKSCNEVCRDQGFICENTHFPAMNSETFLHQMKITCDINKFISDIVHPSVIKETEDHWTCFFQADADLFSCAGRKTSHRRACSCRTFKKDQTALCDTCS
ncbi:alpha-1,6-mannosylglycoprotein 6-beta-N-acetylglucosaminyltransferase A-like [Lingula anatina]|uniref:alpha-1,6-mannosyl-glycoprotein 6-beta-N-acetylglucosaminyltransferase n=1 Tax=Lingula anatina TaxID=7574 RepID=A0A1S3JB65_LINAN|nr:alpha-1,6-mannosylglycoprotein 6-beta-N-acetylglucosaminyltransferase A-like [Lingula anatina]|eukprot:XP_013407642.2 alpha-1,6-mannosylglycoprotein 6-beta-N-acetylglucosaminyltransferase A-like [Lingula anatina]